jgi:hypothetical protein
MSGMDGASAGDVDNDTGFLLQHHGGGPANTEKVARKVHRNNLGNAGTLTHGSSGDDGGCTFQFR